MKAKTARKKRKSLENLERGRRLQKARKKFAEGIIAIVLSGGALPYFVRDCVGEAINSGKEALKKGELCPWAVKHLNEIVLGLELARCVLEHLEEIVTEEDELRALRPHIKEWFEKEGYDSPYRTYPEDELVDRILEQLKGYWDKLDMNAWQFAVDCIAFQDEIEAAKPLMAEWLQEEGRNSSTRAVDKFLEALKNYWSEHGLYGVFDVSGWEAALSSAECGEAPNHMGA